jgi:uncharacterized protein
MDGVRAVSLTRRTALVLGGVLLLGGCQARFGGLRLTMTTGSAGAVYNQLGDALSKAWAAELGIAPPTVLTSAGSGENLDRLLSGQADIGFSAADAAAQRFTAAEGKRLRALVRMHDDYVQVVVPGSSPVHRLADLKGLRVSVGPAGSGVQLIADRLLAAARLSPATGIDRRLLNIDESADALARGNIDVFFWSGGIPTEQVTALARRMPIRVVDLSDVIAAISKQYQEYGGATLSAATFPAVANPVTTLVVPNFLMVTDLMADPVAEALTQGVFDAEPALAAANGAARSIDVRSGIETVPIPLHPGAVAYYRAAHYVSK